jgi:hypothetical protein
LEDEEIMEDFLGFLVVVAIMVAVGYWGFKDE